MAPQSMPEFKKAVRDGTKQVFPYGSTFKWVWSWKGKYPTGVAGMTGYFVAKKKGAKGPVKFYFAQWTDGHGIAVYENSVHHWQAMAMTQADSPRIKGSSGKIAFPAEFGVTV